MNPIDSAITRMANHGGSFARLIAQAYFVADASNKARIVGAFGSLLANYGYKQPTTDRTDELCPNMSDDALSDWANWAQSELRARKAADPVAGIADMESLETGESDAIEICGGAA